MTRPTPKEQVDNMMAGIKNTYEAVAVRHVHSWWVWGLLALTIGFTVGVAYVANHNAKFNAGQAAYEMVPESSGSVRFLTPTDGETIDTNPLLIVESLENGQPSIAPLEFTYAFGGSADFRPLGVTYNSEAPGRGEYWAIPIMFSDPETPAGLYTIQVTRVAMEEPTPLTAQALNSAPGYNSPNLFQSPNINLARPSAKLRFTYQPSGALGGAGGFMGGATEEKHKFCGCENIEVKTSGSIDQKLNNLSLVWVAWNSLGPKITHYDPVPGFEEYWEYAFGFVVTAKLSPGSDPQYCKEGQEVKSTNIYKLGRSDYDENRDRKDTTLLNGVGTNDLSSIGLPGYFSAKALSANERASLMNQLGGSWFNNFEVFRSDGEKYATDDYIRPSKIKYHDASQNPPVIAWGDQPSVNSTKSSLPVKKDVYFIHHVNGSLESRITGNIGMVFDPPGKTCSCKTHLVIESDANGQVVVNRLTTECDTSDGGKNGEILNESRYQFGNGGF